MIRISPFYVSSLMRHLIRLLIFCTACSVLHATYSSCCVAADRILRAGIVGCDTSHVIHFTNFINDPNATGAAANVQVTAAFPGGSPNLLASRDRLSTFVAQVREK